MLRTLIFVVALTAGGVAAWLTLGMQVEEAPAAAIAAEPLPPVAMQEVLVAADDLGQGVALGEASVRWQDWPEDAVNPAYIRRSVQPDALETIAGSVVRSRFIIGEPIRQEKLVAAGSGFLSANLPSGKRAVAVRISAENTAGGFILPNDRVDVLNTTSRQGDSGGNVSRTILRNILVLAIDQNSDESDADSVIGKTATLELDSRQAEIVTAAEASGLLSLALRSVADNGEAQTVEEAPVAEAPPAEPSSHFVRIFRAGQSEIVKVQ